MKKTYITVAVMVLISGIWVSCSKSNETDLAGGGNTCDTVNMKYMANVQPIFQNNCYSCHGDGNVEGGIAMDTYEQVKQLVNNGNLINVITHASGYPAMPEGLPKLSDCNINIIKDWINRGAPNN